MQILLADDHALIREYLREYLGRLAPDVEVWEAGTFVEALDIALRRPHLDLIILDLVMPGMNGMAGLEEMRARCPEVPIAVLSGMTDREDIVAALRAGAQGFIPKTVSGSAILNALRLILSGDTYVPKSVLEEAPDSGLADEERGNAEWKRVNLTPREWDVLTHLTKGLSNKAIAIALDAQEVTVKAHLQSVFRKLGVSNRSQAVIKALDLGMRRRA